jgi:HD-GYP domain-containing protein (c-di-GMP phosphodiesterase class II)
MIRVQVISGPDVGKGGFFLSGRVRVGRSGANDVVLTDGRVSQNHLEIQVDGGEVVVRDNRSLHGTVVRSDGRMTELQDHTTAQSVRVSRSSQLSLGDTILMVDVDLSEISRARGTLSDSQALFRSTFDGDDAVTRRLQADDPRLGSVFLLARSLNAVRELDEILQLVADTVFAAFSSSDHFAVVVPDERTPSAPLKPLRVIRRGGQHMAVDDVQLARRVLDDAYRNRQAMLVSGDDLSSLPMSDVTGQRNSTCMIVPLVGQRGPIGLIQVDSRSARGAFDANDLELLSVIASSTAFAMERIRLTENAYEMFEGIVRLSVTAIDARDPATTGHSERVADYTLRLAMAVNDCSKAPFTEVQFTREELVELRYAALLHDFGKIGVSERVLTKATRLWPGRLDTVLERFDAVRQSMRQAAWSEALSRAERGELAVGEVRATAERLCSNLLQQLDDAEHTIREFQPGQPLTPEARQLFQRLSVRTYLDSRGKARPLLTAEELEHLSVTSGTLTAGEWKEMRGHALKSRTYLSTIPWGPELRRIPEFAGAHHEKLNGTGYPHGLQSDQIALQTRILTIADIFDATTGIDRSYGAPATVSKALEILQYEASVGLLDSALVALFVERVVPDILQDYRLASR